MNMVIIDIYKKYKECAGRVTTDTRTLKGGEMFFALKGENFDGNEYALKALEAGAAYAVVNSSSEVAKSDDPRLIKVEDTFKRSGGRKVDAADVFLPIFKLVDVAYASSGGHSYAAEVCVCHYKYKEDFSAEGGCLFCHLGHIFHVAYLLTERRVDYDGVCKFKRLVRHSHGSTIWAMRTFSV